MVIDSQACTTQPVDNFGENAINNLGKVKWSNHR